MLEIQSSINKRPITYLSDDVNDPKPLRPIDFLPGSCEYVSEGEVRRNYLIRRYRWQQQLLDSFWERWNKEYLRCLHQWGLKSPKGGQTFPQENDVVLVDSRSRFSSNRALWPLGRIIKLYRGNDGFPRAALVKVNRAFIRRPTWQLYPLEVGEVGSLQDNLSNRSTINGPSTSNLPSETGSPETSIPTKCQGKPHQSNICDRELDEEVEQSDRKLVTRSGRCVNPPKRFLL